MLEATTSPADSTPSATTEVDPAIQPIRIFVIARVALTATLISAMRLPVRALAAN
jgi:hypothetical protein